MECAEGVYNGLEDAAVELTVECLGVKAAVERFVFDQSRTAPGLDVQEVDKQSIIIRVGEHDARVVKPLYDNGTVARCQVAIEGLAEEGAHGNLVNNRLREEVDTVVKEDVVVQSG